MGGPSGSPRGALAERYMVFGPEKRRSPRRESNPEYGISSPVVYPLTDVGLVPPRGIDPRYPVKDRRPSQ